LRPAPTLLQTWRADGDRDATLANRPRSRPASHVAHRAGCLEECQCPPPSSADCIGRLPRPRSLGRQPRPRCPSAHAIPCHAMPCHVLDVSEACLLAALEKIPWVLIEWLPLTMYVCALQACATYIHTRLRVWGLVVYLGRGVSWWHGDWAGRRTYIATCIQVCCVHGQIRCSCIDEGPRDWDLLEGRLILPRVSGVRPAWNSHLGSVLSPPLSAEGGARGTYMPAVPYISQATQAARFLEVSPAGLPPLESLSSPRIPKLPLEYMGSTAGPPKHRTKTKARVDGGHGGGWRGPVGHANKPRGVQHRARVLVLARSRLAGLIKRDLTRTLHLPSTPLPSHAVGCGVGRTFAVVSTGDDTRQHIKMGHTLSRISHWPCV